MDSKVVFKKTARLAVTAGLAASMTLGSFPLAIFADATEPEQKPAVEQEGPKAGEAAAEEQEAPKVESVAEETTATATEAAQSALVTEEVAPAATETPQTVTKEDAGAQVKHGDTYTYYATAQEAINAAETNEGDTVELLKDISANTKLTKRLTITSADKSNPVMLTHRLDMDYSNKASGSVIENLKFTYGKSDFLAVEVHASNVTIQNCTFILNTDAQYIGACAIWVQHHGPDGLKVHNNTFEVNTADYRQLIWFMGEQNSACNLTNGAQISDNTVKTSSVENGAWLVSIDGWNKGLTNGITVTGNKEAEGSHVNGVRFSGVSGLTVTNNQFSGDYGVRAVTSKNGGENGATSGNVTVSGNTMTGAHGIDIDGKFLTKGQTVTVSNNTFGENTEQFKGLVAQIGDTTYTSLAAAVKAAKTGDTIKLIADTKLDTTVSISNKITIDGQGHQLNGQLLLGGTDGSTVKGVHFVLNKDTACQAWVASIRIASGKGHNLLNNTFDIASDAGQNKQPASGKAVSIYVFPDRDTNIDGTVIKGNTFNIARMLNNSQGEKMSGWAVNLAVEIGDSSSIENATLEGNTMTAGMGGSASFLAAFAKSGSERLIKNVTVTGNVLAQGSEDFTGMLVRVMGGVDGMELHNNTFGNGTTGINFQQDARWGSTLPSKNIDIKSNKFNTNYAVVDSGVMGDLATGNNGLDSVNGLKFDEYTGEDANALSANTLPFVNTSSAKNSYGAMFYDVDGKTLLDWQVVKAGEAPQDKKVGEKPGYASTWYTDAEGKNAYDFKSDASKDGLLKLYLKRTAIEYKVSYDLDGGVNAKENPSTFTVESGEIKLAAPTRDGYDFAGWVDKDGKKVESIVADTVGDIALKATWTKKAEPVANHTVTFVDGLGNKTTQTVTDGDKAVAPTDPKHDGWEFLGWYTSEDFKELYDFDAPVTGDLTLYGGWRKADTGDVTEPDGEEKPETQKPEGETKPETQKPAETKPVDKKPVGKKTLPQTGDSSALPMAVAASAGAVAIAAGAVVSKRRKQE